MINWTYDDHGRKVPTMPEPTGDGLEVEREQAQVQSLVAKGQLIQPNADSVDAEDRRFQAAVMIMASMCGTVPSVDSEGLKVRAKRAVQGADALLKALREEKHER